MSQPVVIIEVLVAQSQPVEPLGQQLRQRVIYKTLIARVGKATGQRARQPEALIDLAQEQDAAVTGEGASGKIGHDLARTQVLKEHGLVITVCRRSRGGVCFHWAQ